MRVAVGNISEAIRAVRAALGETQEGMARRIGVGLRTYIRWESGESRPRGDWLLKVMALCPNSQTRAKFTANVNLLAPRTSTTQESEGRAEDPSPDQLAELELYYNDVSQAVNLLYEAAASGSSGARELLKDLAAKFRRRAGDWRKAKYRRLM